MSAWLARLRTVSPTTIDAGLTVLALAAQAAPFLFTSRSDSRPWTLLELFPSFLVSLPLIWRRRAPVVCLLITAVGICVYSVVGDRGPEQPIWYGALVMTYTIADQVPAPLRRIVLVASAIGIAVVGGVFGSVNVAVREGFMWGAAYALGRGAHIRRAYGAMLEERARRLERERESEVERAAERERARIARDMHDVLAHAVSVMAVQAEAGPVVVRSSPERAEAAFDAIAAAGRDAMIQLRQILGLLSDRDGARSPRPSLDRIPDLVAAVGPHASLVTSGPGRALRPDVEVAAYRIVQEALTNVIKHANAETATVALEWTDADLLITVVDDGPHARTPERLPGTGTGNGNGLIGIRERAVACGGSARFGPAPGATGFEVSVRLPA